MTHEKNASKQFVNMLWVKNSKTLIFLVLVNPGWVLHCVLRGAEADKYTTMCITLLARNTLWADSVSTLRR